MAKEKATKERVSAKGDGAEESSSSLTAKKDFHLCHNDFNLVIKAGDDLSSVPEIYLQNLKTEGVI